MLEKAQSFLKFLRTTSDATTIADDLLLFFYDLHDHYEIVRSSSSRFSARSFNILSDLLYNLESKPDATIKSEHWKTFIEMVLEDIASKRIVIAKK